MSLSVCEIHEQLSSRDPLTKKKVGYMLEELSRIFLGSNGPIPARYAEELLCNLVDDDSVCVRCAAYVILKTDIGGITPCTETSLMIFEKKVSDVEIMLTQFLIEFTEVSKKFYQTF